MQHSWEAGDDGKTVWKHVTGLMKGHNKLDKSRSFVYWYPGKDEIAKAKIMSFEVAGDPEAWRKVGFVVDESGFCHVGDILFHIQGQTDWPYGIQRIHVGGIPVPEPRDFLIGGVKARFESQLGQADRPPAGPNGADQLLHVNWAASNLSASLEDLHAAVGIKPSSCFEPIGATYADLFNIDAIEMLGSDSGAFKPFKGRDVVELYFEVPDMNKTIGALPAGFILSDGDAGHPYEGRRMVALDSKKLGLTVNVYFKERPTPWK